MQRRQFIFTGAATALFAGIAVRLPRTCNNVACCPCACGKHAGSQRRRRLSIFRDSYAEPPFGELRWRPPRAPSALVWGTASDKLWAYMSANWWIGL